MHSGALRMPFSGTTEPWYTPAPSTETPTTSHMALTSPVGAGVPQDYYSSEISHHDPVLSESFTLITCLEASGHGTEVIDWWKANIGRPAECLRTVAQLNTAHLALMPTVGACRHGGYLFGPAHQAPGTLRPHHHLGEADG